MKKRKGKSKKKTRTLKLCPFCGNAGIVSPETQNFNLDHDDIIMVHAGALGRCYAVRCTRCMAEGPVSYQWNSARKAWNKSDARKV